MKKPFFTLFLLLSSVLLNAQTNVDSLIQVGIKQHDRGEYKQAIETYQAALEINPTSVLANYELALTHERLKEYKRAIKYIDKVLDVDGEHLLEAYVLKGSCLDYLGKSKQSIKLFKKGIRKFGEHYLLYYNLGVSYYKVRDLSKAEDALLEAIRVKPDHPGSHFILSSLMADQNQRVKSLLGLYFFLFVEANSERSKLAYELLQHLLNGSVTQDKEQPTQIEIALSPKQLDEEFGIVNMRLSMSAATKYLDENKDKSELEMFITQTTSFFNMLKEKKGKKHKGVWWDVYVPLFSNLAQSEHMETYCYYISQASSEEAKEWVAKNNEQLNQLGIWLDKEE